MVNVIGVRFENAGKLYFFTPGALWPTPGDFVIVETTRGIEFGEVVTEVREIDDTKLTSPLKQVVRIATEEDILHDKENKAAEKEAFTICQKKIADHKLDMKLVSVEYTFDNKTILFYFTANGRVDFRSLVKDLAGVFKTRIELRQIGVRDEAKMLGGLGPCGRPICCGTFLGDFQPDGEGTESVAQPHQNQRCLRPSHVLPEVRAGYLRGNPQVHAQRGQGSHDARRRGRRVRIENHH